MPANGAGWPPEGWEARPSLVGRDAEGGSLSSQSQTVENTGAAGRLCDQAREAARAAKASKCPRVKAVRWAWDQGTLRAFPIPCKSWACSWCGWRKKAAAAYMVAEGIRQADIRGERVRFITLTEDPARPFDQVAAVSKAWNRLRTRMKKEGLLDQYAQALETTEKGRPHLHVVATGEYMPQATLSEYAARAGFGPVADIRAVDLQGDDSDQRSAAYISKELADYVSKTGRAGSQYAGTRIRPIRTSRQWFPGGLRRAEAVLVEQYRPEDSTTGADYWHVFARDLGDSIRVEGRDDLGGFLLRQSGEGSAASVTRFTASERDRARALTKSGESVSDEEKTGKREAA